LSLTFLSSSVYAVQQSLLVREMHFNRLAKIDLWTTLLASVTGIGAALLGSGVMSLVYQSLVGSFFTMVLTMRAGRWRPRFIFRWDELKSVGSYSLNLTGFNVFNYFARNADYLLIGKFLGARNLGYYTLAYRLLLYPLTAVSDVVARVMFPVYSRVQDDNRTFREMYLRVAGAIALITFPMMLGLMSTGRAFVFSFYGAKWEPIIILLLILAPVGLVQSILTTVGLIYQAKGRTDWMFRWGIVAGLATAISFVVGLPFGITGVSISYAVTCGFLLYPGFAIPGKLIELSFRDVVDTVSGIFYCSAAMASGVWLLSYLLPGGWPAWSCLAVQVLFGVMLYWMMIHFFDLKAYRDVRQLIVGEFGIK
jgi:O-antigen/teichoic acid export membrane protein